MQHGVGAKRIAEIDAKLASPAPVTAHDDLAVLTPEPKEQELPRVTALGGGHGLAVVLQGFRDRESRGSADGPHGGARPTAIVTVADDGGSSGALRRALNIQSLGDIRNCLLALSDGDPTLQDLFDFRFNAGVGKHSLGNLMLAALTLLEKDFGKAVERANELLAVQGRVIPATTGNVELLAEFGDGDMMKGESRIVAARRGIRRISLLPADVRASPAAVAAIRASDLIVIGPGSLYTSLIPNLLLGEIVEAIRASGARVVLIMNLMSEPGETEGYSASDIVAVLREHVPDLPLDTVLINNTPMPRNLLGRYALKGSVPIKANPALIAALGATPVSCALLAHGQKIRHDSAKLARTLLALTAGAEHRAYNESSARKLGCRS